jgi:hypothetical protein
MFDGHEDPMALGILELKVLCRGPVGCLEQPGSGVTAESMRRVEHQLTGVEGGSKLRWQVFLVYPPSGLIKRRWSGDIGGGRPASGTGGAGAGHHYEGDGDEDRER